jgi:hypothetical protein
MTERRRALARPMTCSSTAVIPMTAVPSRPPDTADRPRCTTFMPFIHMSSRSSNAPIPGTLRPARTCQCPPQMPLTATGARRPAFSGARPEVLSRDYPMAAPGAFGALACPTPRRSDCSCTSASDPAERRRSAMRIRRSGRSPASPAESASALPSGHYAHGELVPGWRFGSTRTATVAPA